MSVPILDDAYMQRRAQRERFRLTMESFANYSHGAAVLYGAYRDPIKDAQAQYVAGEIDAAALESRVEHALRRRPQGLTG